MIYKTIDRANNRKGQAYVSLDADLDDLIEALVDKWLRKQRLDIYLTDEGVYAEFEYGYSYTMPFKEDRKSTRLNSSHT